MFWGGSAGVPSAAAALKKTLQISGHVVNMEGQPLADVDVKLEMDGALRGKRSMKTNAKGEFNTDVKADFTQSEILKGTLSGKKPAYAEGREVFNLRIDDQSSGMDIVLCKLDDGSDQLSIPLLIKSLAPNLKIGAEKEFAEENEKKEFIRGYELLMDGKNPEETVDLLRKSVERASDCLNCQLLLGLALMSEGSWNGVKHQMEEATLISDILEIKRPELPMMKGIIEAWHGHDKEAVGFYLKVLELDPQNALVLQELGRAGITQRNWEVAEKFLGNFIKSNWTKR